MTPAPVHALAFGAHPDDVELTVGGTLLVLADLGYRTAVVDLTRGELGTRGTPEIRAREAAEAAARLGVAHRENLDLGDGAILPSDAVRAALVGAIRRLRPTLVLGPIDRDLHPDHAWGGRLLQDACFLAGVARYAPGLPAHRPRALLGYVSHTEVEPSLVVDISAVFDRKRQACEAYTSQFHDPKAGPADTYLSRPEFWEWWEARARNAGHSIGVRFGEPLIFAGPIPVPDPVAQFADYGYYPKSEPARGS
jgi:bacillithiol biosynthesis deacetylase BshB1